MESMEIPAINSPKSVEYSKSLAGSLKWVVASTMALANLSGFFALKIPEPTKTPSQPNCINKAASAGVETPPAQNKTTGNF